MSSAVFEMGDHLATIDIVRKVGVLCPRPFCEGKLSPHDGVAWAKAYLRTQWYLSSFSHFATIDMG